MTGKSRTARLTQRTVRYAAALAVATLLAPAAHAFTFEDGKGNTIPKFDLEEQARQFRKPRPRHVDGGKEVDGDADRQSAVRRRPQFSPFGSPFGFRSGNSDRRHYDRLFAPDSMKSLYD